MTQIELAFRHIAANDFSRKPHQRRTICQLSVLLQRKRVVASKVMAAAVAAYDDEFRSCEAERHGLCYQCKTSAPMHWHGQPFTRDGTTVIRFSVCKDSAVCTAPPSNTSTICANCSASGNRIGLDKRNAKTRRLLAAGATVPNWMIRWLERAA